MSSLTLFQSKLSRLHYRCLAQASNAREAAIEIGKMLLARKAECAHGEWISSVVPSLPFERRQAGRYMKLASEASEGITSTADPKQLGYVGSTPSTVPRDDASWFTPAYVLDAARTVLGTIDFDPFSSREANKTVRAARYYNEENDALKKETWSNNPQHTVWMNPPYGVGVINKAVERFCQEWDDGTFAAGIVLVNNASDTTWFRELGMRAAAMCFTYGRIKFVSQDGKAANGNTRGQTFFYFGGDVKGFRDAFKDIGMVVVEVRS